MRKNPRRKIVRVELRANDGPSKTLWANCATYVLECGHRINVGVVRQLYQPVTPGELLDPAASIEDHRKQNRCACWECYESERMQRRGGK
jgi:hypothetical protein